MINSQELKPGTRVRVNGWPLSGRSVALYQLARAFPAEHQIVLVQPKKAPHAIDALRSLLEHRNTLPLPLLILIDDLDEAPKKDLEVLSGLFSKHDSVLIAHNRAQTTQLAATVSDFDAFREVNLDAEERIFLGEATEAYLTVINSVRTGFGCEILDKKLSEPTLPAVLEYLRRYDRVSDNDVPPNPLFEGPPGTEMYRRPRLEHAQRALRRLLLRQVPSPHAEITLVKTLGAFVSCGIENVPAHAAAEYLNHLHRKERFGDLCDDLCRNGWLATADVPVLDCSGSQFAIHRWSASALAEFNLPHFLCDFVLWARNADVLDDRLQRKVRTEGISILEEHGRATDAILVLKENLLLPWDEKTWEMQLGLLAALRQKRTEDAEFLGDVTDLLRAGHPESLEFVAGQFSRPERLGRYRWKETTEDVFGAIGAEPLFDNWELCERWAFGTDSLLSANERCTFLAAISRWQSVPLVERYAGNLEKEVPSNPEIKGCLQKTRACCEQRRATGQVGHSGPVVVGWLGGLLGAFEAAVDFLRPFGAVKKLVGRAGYSVEAAMRALRDEKEQAALLKRIEEVTTSDELEELLREKEPGMEPSDVRDRLNGLLGNADDIASLLLDALHTAFPNADPEQSE